jgi:hypothetical protein
MAKKKKAIHMLAARRKVEVKAPSTPPLKAGEESNLHPGLAWVSYVPRKALSQIPSIFRIVSIGGKYDEAPNLERFKDHIRIFMDVTQGDAFINPSITPEMVKELILWVLKDQTSPIIVHCGEGSIRSPAVAEFIARHMGRQLIKGYQHCTGTHYPDKGISRTLKRHALDVLDELDLA